MLGQSPVHFRDQHTESNDNKHYTIFSKIQLVSDKRNHAHGFTNVGNRVVSNLEQIIIQNKHKQHNKAIVTQ